MNPQNASVASSRLPDARTAASLPGVSTEVIELLRTLGAADITAEQISATLSRDLTLSARVLKVVNSAYYGQSRSVASVERAVVVLGFPAVRSIAMAAGCFRLRRLPGGDGQVTPAQVLAHGLAVALGARELARARPGLCREEAFMAGLLHDFGLLLEMHGAPEHFATLETQLAALEAAGPREWLAGETSVFGRCHAESAAAIFGEWQLPDRIVAAVAAHHSPLAAEPALRDLAAVVALADSLAADAGLGLAGPSEPLEPPPELLEHLEFDWGARQSLQDTLRAEFTSLRGVLADER